MFWFSCRKQSKKKKKSKKSEEDETKDLPAINFKGSRKGFNLNQSLRSYRSLTDDEPNSARSEPRDGDDQRREPSVRRKGSYQTLTEENSQELVDEMFGDSPEKSRKRSGKKQRRRRKRDDEEADA